MNIRYLVKQQSSLTPNMWLTETEHTSIEDARKVAESIAERTGRPVKIVKQTIVEEDVA